VTVSAAAVGGLPALLLRATTSTQSATSGASRFGPAYLLGGSTKRYDRGLYTALQRQVGWDGTVASQVLARQRAAALKEAADLIRAGATAAGRDRALELLERDANDVTALRLVGHSYLLEGNYAEAERYLRRAAGAAPDNAAVREDLRIAVTLQASDEEVLHAARSRLSKAATRTEGLRLLSYLAARSPDNAEVFVTLAEGFAAAYRSREAAGALQEALARAGAEYADRLIAVAETLVRRHPQAGLAHALHGRALQKAGRFDEAVRAFEVAQSLEPEDLTYTSDLAGAYIARAVDLLERGDAVNARVDLEAARALDPAHADLPTATARLAMVRAERELAGGRYNSALSELNQAADNAPDDEAFRTRLAALFNRAGLHLRDEGADSAALSAFIRAYELDPDSGVARTNVAELSYSEGVAALNRNDFDAAIEHFQRARQADPSEGQYRTALADAYDQRGVVFMGQGELLDAIRDFRKGVRLDPTNASLWANLAAAEQQLQSS